MLIMNALLEVEFNKNKQRPIATNHCHWLDQMCFQSDWPFCHDFKHFLKCILKVFVSVNIEFY